MKKIFIAATKQNDGKTTLSLGLICNFQRRFKKTGFIKRSASAIWKKKV